MRLVGDELLTARPAKLVKGDVAAALNRGLPDPKASGVSAVLAADDGADFQQFGEAGNAGVAVASCLDNLETGPAAAEELAF